MNKDKDNNIEVEKEEDLDMSGDSIFDEMVDNIP